MNVLLAGSSTPGALEGIYMKELSKCSKVILFYRFVDEDAVTQTKRFVQPATFTEQLPWSTLLKPKFARGGQTSAGCAFVQGWSCFLNPVRNQKWGHTGQLQS